MEKSASSMMMTMTMRTMRTRSGKRVAKSAPSMMTTMTMMTMTTRRDNRVARSMSWGKRVANKPIINKDNDNNNNDDNEEEQKGASMDSGRSLSSLSDEVAT